MLAKYISRYYRQPRLAAPQHYHCPGNVRELENILERTFTLYDGKCIEIDDLSLPVSLQND